MPAFKKALITGCGRGIGADVARQLASHGTEIIAFNRSRAPLEQLIASLGDDAKITPYYVDLTDLEALDGLVQQALKEHPNIDLVLLNAGLDTPQPIESFDWRIARQQIDTNLTSNYVFASHVIPQMLQRGSGRFAVLSSLASFISCPFEHAYSASKAGARMMIDGLRAELLHRPVDISGIYPGFVATDMIAGNAFDSSSAVSPEEAAKLIVDGLESGKEEIIFPEETYALTQQAAGLGPLERAAVVREQMDEEHTLS